MRRIHFDLDALRSYALGLELGSFAQAALRLDRSTSAVSAQLGKLEDQAGTPLLRRAGRGMLPTEAGETLLGYARRLLELNDEATAALRGNDLAGGVRLGLQEDFGEHLLPAVLGRFARAHPRVRVENRIARNAELLERVRDGRLDLALAWDAGTTPPYGERLGSVPLRWIGASAGTIWQRDTGEPLPLVMLEAPCLMRSAATAALDHAGIAWRVAFTSASLAGIWAAVSAGLGITLRTPIGLPPSVRDDAGDVLQLPAMPSLGLGLYRAEATPPATIARLADLVREALPPTVSGG